MNELFIRLAFPIHFILSKDNGGQPKNYILWYYQRPGKTDFITVRVLHLSHVLIVVWKEISRTFHGFTFKCCAFFTEKCLTISLILLVCYMLYVHFLNKEIFESQGVKVQYCRILRIVKLREREGQRVDLGGSLKGHLWMVDGGWWYTFPWCFTLNLVDPPTTASLLISRIQPSMDQVR